MSDLWEQLPDRELQELLVRRVPGFQVAHLAALVTDRRTSATYIDWLLNRPIPWI